jgi:hypothetical protein
VPAGAWKGVRLKNIPLGARIGTEVESDGLVEILLLDAEDYARFPSPKHPVFRGKTSDRLEISVLAPASGDYYVLIDNRTGSDARAVALTLSGEVEEGGGSDAEAEAELRDFEARMAAMFAFEPFPIRVETCGKPQTTADSAGVVLCREYAVLLHERLQHPRKMGDALLFTLFHEVGHVLLAQWGQPTFADEETADEFATAVMVMLGHGERVRAMAEVFRADPSLLDALAKTFRDERHSLSESRVQTILSRVDDPSLVRRWQTVFVPHMQTAVLERLKREPTTWSDLALVDRELEARN